MTSETSVPFVFDEALVRVVMDESREPWFVAKDVAIALGYSQSSIDQLGNLFRHVPTDWSDLKPIKVRSESGTTQERNMLCLAEPGLYFFAARSDKPKALPFQRWLAGEVLPAIRKTGSYRLPQSEPIPLPDEVRRLRPALRERVLFLAVQTARLSGSDDPAMVDGLFAKFCRMVGEGLVSETPVQESEMPGVPMRADPERSLIVRFAEECCEESKGSRVQATKLYRRFCHWFRARSDGAMPNQHVFGRIMRDLYPYKRKKGGTCFYYDLGLKTGELQTLTEQA